MAVSHPCSTHEVTNQVPPLSGHDVAQVPALLEGLVREGAGWHLDMLHNLGNRAGTEEVQRWGDEANASSPVLNTHDRFGNRVDEVVFHPSWHLLMAAAASAGLGAVPWVEDRSGAHVARAASFFVWSHVEAGHTCPMSMTYAAVPALWMQEDLAEQYVPLLASRTYDPGLRPAAEKSGLLAGMGMTEKQGGSDVRSNSTTAMPAGDGTWRLLGHKWFTSAPMNDIFLVLAQAPGGLSCFLAPRVLPDGSRNTFRFQRLKNKLGNRSNASAELELDDTVAWLVGEEGRGVRVIIEMVAMTRMDNVAGSAAGMHAAVLQALHHSRHRLAFGSLLADKALMRNVLADMALECEAAITLMMRLAGAVDRSASGDHQEQEFKRLGIPLGKYWVCKRQPALVAEALECLGGNGYVEDSGMPRLYREAPLNGLWEGSGNVNALDILRALERQPESLEAFAAEIEPVASSDSRIAQSWNSISKDLHDTDQLEWSARRLTERLALVLQASLLVRHSPQAVADAFCSSRLDGDHGMAFGTLPSGVNCEAILERVGLS